MTNTEDADALREQRDQAVAELTRFVEASLEPLDYTRDSESNGWEDDDYERARANITEMHRVLLVRLERLLQMWDREESLTAELARLREVESRYNDLINHFDYVGDRP